MKLFLWNIYYSLYIRREARRDLHTEQAFKEYFLLFFGKSVVGRTFILLWRHAVFFCTRCWSSHASGVSFVFPYTPKKPSRFTQRFFITCITSIEERTSRSFQ